MAERGTVEWKEEEQKLGWFRNGIKENIEYYIVKKDEVDKKTKDLYDHYHSNNPELISDLMVSLDMQDQVGAILRKNIKAEAKPYFGRIDFHENEGSEDYSLYIGKSGIADRAGNTMIVDWRAPVASVYYESDLGQSAYTAPQGDIPVRLDLKRTFEIENGDLLDYYEAEVIANDDFLLKYLGKNKEEVLGEIVATIQKEQNTIIRDQPWHNVVVQGVAGSGKTTVAMHRISYILYNYPKRFKPQEFFIIGSNRMLLGYITGVLPDLDVYNVNQMTMEDFFLYLLEKSYKPKKPKKKAIIDEEGGTERPFVCDSSFFSLLEGFMDEYENRVIQQRDLRLDGEIIMEREEIARYVNEYPHRTLEEKIKMLNDRLIFLLRHKLERINTESSELAKTLRKYRNFFGKPNQKLPLAEVCGEFLSGCKAEGAAILLEKLEKGEQDINLLCVLVYIKSRLRKTREYETVRHMVVDEAQDFGIFVFQVVKKVLGECTFTVMGDVSQNIHYYSGMNGWNELNRLVFNGKDDKFYTLSKSYRNTIEISRYAEHVLDKCSFEKYPIDPVIRHGREIEEIETVSLNELTWETVQAINATRGRGYDTIAVICRDEREAEAVRDRLSVYIEVNMSGYDNAEFTKGVMVLPIRLTKGLEFDSVILWNPDRQSYELGDADAKLLYVAITRALHELFVIYKGEKSRLLT